MRLTRRWSLAYMPALSLGLCFVLVGCGATPEPERPAKRKAPEGGGGGGAAVAKTPASGGAKELALKDFNATLKGRVTYNGDAEPVVAMKKPDKNTDICTSDVPQEGWYVDKSSDKKGVQFAVVFLRPAGGMRLPKTLPDNVVTPGSKQVVMGQPKCQFEPRVVVLGPGQVLHVKNDSTPSLSHDANISGGDNDIKGTLAPGSEKDYDLAPNDREPNKVSCNQHASFMNAYVWKFSHPFAAVTDADGKFEIKNVPTAENGKFELCVWHEMIKENKGIKVLKEIEIKAGAVVEEAIAIPK